MIKKKLVYLIFSFLLMPLALANDATSSSPPGVTMSASGGVPTPPVCSAATQMLRWTGTAWQCIANPGVTNVGKGAVAGYYDQGGSCPSGTTALAIGKVQMNSTIPRYLCIKN